MWEHVSDFAAYLSDLYLLFGKGFLLVEGGIEDQPAWYVDAMLAMERAITEETEKRRKRYEAEHKR